MVYGLYPPVATAAAIAFSASFRASVISSSVGGCRASGGPPAISSSRRATASLASFWRGDCVTKVTLSSKVGVSCPTDGDTSVIFVLLSFKVVWSGEVSVCGFWSTSLPRSPISRSTDDTSSVTSSIFLAAASVALGFLLLIVIGCSLFGEKSYTIFGLGKPVSLYITLNINRYCPTFKSTPGLRTLPFLISCLFSFSSYAFIISTESGVSKSDNLPFHKSSINFSIKSFPSLSEILFTRLTPCHASSTLV